MRFRDKKADLESGTVRKRSRGPQTERVDWSFKSKRLWDLKGSACRGPVQQAQKQDRQGQKTLQVRFVPSDRFSSYVGRFLNGSFPVRFLMVLESQFVSIRRLPACFFSFEFWDCYKFIAHAYSLWLKRNLHVFSIGFWVFLHSNPGNKTLTTRPWSVPPVQQKTFWWRCFPPSTATAFWGGILPKVTLRDPLR